MYEGLYNSSEATEDEIKITSLIFDQIETEDYEEMIEIIRK
jgi:hypothetical protein